MVVFRSKKAKLTIPFYTVSFVSFTSWRRVGVLDPYAQPKGLGCHRKVADRFLFLVWKRDENAGPKQNTSI